MTPPSPTHKHTHTHIYPICPTPTHTTRAHHPASRCRCWAEGVVPKSDDYAKGALRTAIKEKNWGTFGGGMSLIGITEFLDDGYR